MLSQVSSVGVGALKCVVVDVNISDGELSSVQVDFGRGKKLEGWGWIELSWLYEVPRYTHMEGWLCNGEVVTFLAACETPILRREAGH